MDTERLGIRLPLVVIVALASALVLGVVPSARATTNIVPNPGFEVDCGGVPCDWIAGNATITRDTSTFHSGVASLKISTGASQTGSAGTGCVPVVLTAGNHDVSFWYDNSGPNVQTDFTRLEVAFFSGGGCSAFLAGDELFGTATSGWSQATGTMTVPPNTTGVFFTLYVTCAAGGACSVNYDDVDFEEELLAVTVHSLSGKASKRGVLVRWRTGIEIDTLGFHVYRWHGGKRVRVTRALIPAKGSMSGARYSFLDRRAPRGKLVYRLQAVDLDGSRAWHGRALVTRR